MEKNRINRIWFIGLTLVLYWGGFTAHAQSNPILAEPDQTKPSQVKIARLDEISITINRSVPATAISLRNAVVASQLSAQVIEMSHEPGDLVDQGDPIASLDCQDYTLSLESARSQIAALKARLNLARQQLARLNQLKQNRNASEEQINQRQAELEIVSAEISTQSIAIKAAEQQVKRCVIRAPFSGLITSTEGQVGNFLTPGAAVVALVDIERVELKATLQEARVSELVTNPPFFEFGGENWPVTIRTIFPVIDLSTQTREIRFNFSDQKPAPGSIGRLRWTLSGNTIPATYLLTRAEQTGIFVVASEQSDRVDFIPFAHAIPGQPVTVDLPGTILIVTEGRFGLEHGQRVLID